MKRLVGTSNGWLELDVNHLGIVGLSVRVAFFGEGGWAAQVETWDPEEGESLASFLARVGRIPAEEAEQIATETLGEWRGRGGEGAGRGRFIGLTLFIAALFGLAAVGAAAVVAAIVFLLWKLLG